MNDTIPLATPSLLDLAGQFGITDPNTLRLLEFMRQQNEEEEEKTAEEAPAEEGVDAEVLNKLVRENRELHTENEYLIDRIETLAAALGACPVCWGEDHHCDECRGRGAPGVFLPDREAFRVFVLPAIHRMRKRRRVHTGVSRQTQHDATVSNTIPDEIRRGKEKG